MAIPKEKKKKKSKSVAENSVLNMMIKKEKMFHLRQHSWNWRSLCYLK